MALPIKEKVWQFSHNNQFGPDASAQVTYRNAILALKNTFKGFASSPWIVRGSSNSVAAAAVGDGVDRINAATDWVASNSDAGARSWIVLRQPGLGNGEILLEGRSAVTPLEGALRIWWSPTGIFTGGATNARPTATDEINISGASGTNFIGTGSNPIQGVMHIWQSTDGEITRVVFHNGGIAVGFWSFEKLGDPVTGLTLPYQMTMNFNTGVGAIVQNQIIQVSPGPFWSYHAGGSFQSFWGSFAYGSGLALVASQNAGIYKNGWDGSWPFMEIKAFGSTVPNVGVMGRVRDMWMGSTWLIEGRTFPSDGTNQYAQFGHFIFPWSGVVPIIQ